MGTETIHPDWAEAPIVRYALDKAGEGADALTVLETLHGMMTDLEERAPGVPFGEILRAFDPQTAARGRMAARAIIEQDESLTDEDREAVLALIPCTGHAMEDKPDYAPVAAALHAGEDRDSIARRLGVTDRYVYLVMRREGIFVPKKFSSTLDPSLRQAIVDRLTAGDSYRSIQKQFGIGKFTLRRISDSLGMTQKTDLRDHPNYEAAKEAVRRPERPSLANLATSLGLSHRQIQAVYDELAEAGEVPTRTSKGRPRKVAIGDVLRLRSSGLTINQTAEQLGCSRRTISNILKEMKS